jgi:hypothetical protein
MVYNLINMYNIVYSYDICCSMQFCWINSSSVCVTGCVFIPITIQEVNICLCNTSEVFNFVEFMGSSREQPH